MSLFLSAFFVVKSVASIDEVGLFNTNVEALAQYEGQGEWSFRWILSDEWQLCFMQSVNVVSRNEKGIWYLYLIHCPIDCFRL